MFGSEKSPKYNSLAGTHESRLNAGRTFHSRCVSQTRPETMSDRVILVSVDEMMSAQFVPTELIADLLSVSQVSDSELRSLRQALESTRVLTEEQILDQLVADHVRNKDFSTGVASALKNLRPDTMKRFISRVANWREATSENSMKFPENLFALLPAKLELLITEYSALSQLRKAVRLRTILGNVLLAADFVCDARPVFNTEQNRIDSMLAMTTLRLEIESQSGDKKCVEVMLSEQDLGELIEKGQKAQSKIEVINNAINNWVVS